MYIRFQFKQNDKVANASQPEEVKPATYTPSTPSVFENLPDNTIADTMISSTSGSSNEKCYYMDCGDLDVKTAEKAVKIFKDKKFGTNKDCMSQLSLTEDEILPFLQDMKSAIDSVKNPSKISGFMTTVQSYCTQRNLLFTAGTAAVVGVVGYGLYKLGNRSE